MAWVVLLPACQNADAITQAARFGDSEKLRDCIESGIPVDHADPAGETPLFHIIGAGSGKAFQLLLENDANIRLRDNQGNTTLHKAVTFGRSDFVERLIERGVDIDATNKVGATALHYAVRSANLSIVNLLIAKGANSVMKDEKGSTPKEVAQAMNDQEGVSGPMGQTISKKQIIKIILALTNSAQKR